LEPKIIFSKHNFEVKIFFSKFEKKTFRSSQGGSVMKLFSPFIEMNDIVFKKKITVEHTLPTLLGTQMWVPNMKHRKSKELKHVP
jgi:hypothetical protein